MRLVVDASTLVAEALRVRGREMLKHPDLTLYITVHTWNETDHELRRRLALLTLRGRLDAGMASPLLEDVMTTIANRVSLVTDDAFADRLDEGRRPIPRDARDVPVVVLALALDCGI